MAKDPPKKDEQRDDAETQRLRDEALKRALGMPAKPKAPKAEPRAKETGS
jgi:hypothetical protein